MPLILALLAIALIAFIQFAQREILLLCRIQKRNVVYSFVEKIPMRVHRVVRLAEIIEVIVTCITMKMAVLNCCLHLITIIDSICICLTCVAGFAVVDDNLSLIQLLLGQARCVSCP